MTFQNPVDIANRALQHIGSLRIDPTLGFAENSRQAAECAFAYDKLRRAELRRNVWRFATRKAVLRPINSPGVQGPGSAPSNAPQTPTMFISPAMWVSTVTYFPGQLVSDQNGIFWISVIPDNLGNQPGQVFPAWEQYFGPLAVQPYDPTVTYFAGELVYSTVGDGKFLVYASLQNSNIDNPNVPVLWSASIFYFKDQITIFYPAWSGATTYTQGQTVSRIGNYYTSLTAGNLNNDPTLDTTNWVLVPSQPTQSVPTGGIIEWSSTSVYNMGSFVDYAGVQYVSIQTNNLAQNPLTATTFWKVLTGGTLYLSLIDANLNNEPDLAPAPWSSVMTYGAAAKVAATDGFIYSSIAGGNLNHNPVSSIGFWTNTNVLTPWTGSFAGGTGANQFTPITTALNNANIFYPIGAGPASQAGTKNVFRLPANFLRQAPQDPRAGSTSYLGAPSGLLYTDWEYEGNYIVSRWFDPIVFRFVADVVDVTQFDDMFCEGLAARIALEVAQPLSQDLSKLQSIASQYQKFMTEARLINGIETGPVEPAEDDFIAARM